MKITTVEQGKAKLDELEAEKEDVRRQIRAIEKKQREEERKARAKAESRYGKILLEALGGDYASLDEAAVKEYLSATKDAALAASCRK